MRNFKEDQKYIKVHPSEKFHKLSEEKCWFTSCEFFKLGGSKNNCKKYKSIEKCAEHEEHPEFLKGGYRDEENFKYIPNKHKQRLQRNLADKGTKVLKKCNIKECPSYCTTYKDYCKDPINISLCPLQKRVNKLINNNEELKTGIAFLRSKEKKGGK